jgi:mercuric ion binding protein
MLKSVFMSFTGALLCVSFTSGLARAGAELTVGVKGMVCAFCAQGIEKKFRSQAELEDIKVSLENKFVKIKFKEGKSLSENRIAELLKDAGYEANFNSSQKDKP